MSGFFDFTGITWVEVALFSSTPWVFKKIADYYVEGKIKNHFTEMQKKLDFNYQRLITDFGMYSKKRHKVYPLLFQLALETENRIITIHNRGGRPLLTEFTEKDLLEYLNEVIRVPEKPRDEIMKYWNDGKKEEAKHLIRERETLFNYHEAEKVSRKFWGLLDEKRLYLSDEVEVVLDELRQGFDRLLFLSDSSAAGRQLQALQRVSINEKEKLEKAIADNLARLNKLMKKDLSKGDY